MGEADEDGAGVEEEELVDSIAELGGEVLEALESVKRPPEVSI